MQIEGLTPLQQTICDSLWAAEDPNEVIQYLPKRLRPMAQSLLYMIIAEALDEVEDVDLAREVLANIAK
jgi:predicted DNA-binding protein